MPDSPRPTPPSPAGNDATVIRKREHFSRPALGEGPPEPSGSLIGLKLGEYDVIAQLGAGGMGIVYRGVQPQIGKTVAIKVLKPEVATGDDSVQALLAEARAVNSIHHPGIVDIFSFGSTPDGRPYVVMELLEGDSLDGVLRAVGRFKPLEAIDLLEQMLSALDAAHTAGVIHRDLKPANIHLTQMKDGTWRVKLLDFGLAKLTAPGATSVPQTQQNMVRGTPEYMAPEQARAGSVSPQTDLYAIGVVAFELLTGELPFKATNPIELLMQHISAPPPAPSSLEPSMPPAFEALILRLLAKDVEARPESALAVRRELLKLKKQLIEGGTQIRRRPVRPSTPVSAPAAEAPPSPPVGKLVAALVVLVVCLVAGLVVLRQPAAETDSVVEPEKIEPEKIEPVKIEPVKVADPVKIDEPVKVEPVKVEPVKVDPPQPVVKPVAEPVEPPPVKKVEPVRPRPKGRTADEVKKLIADLDAEASKRPPGEARSRKRALDEFREELNAGGKPDELWKQLKEYERSSR